EVLALDRVDPDPLVAEAQVELSPSDGVGALKVELAEDRGLALERAGFDIEAVSKSGRGGEYGQAPPNGSGERPSEGQLRAGRQVVGERASPGRPRRCDGQESPDESEP